MLEHCKVVDSGLNPRHALLFLYLPWVGRGQEALCFCQLRNSWGTATLLQHTASISIP